MHDGFTHTLTVGPYAGQQESVFNLTGNTIVFDSFSPPCEVAGRNRVINNVSKSNDSSRSFHAEFFVEVNANISAVLHPGIVLDYMIVDKQSKQVVQAPNKHPTRNTMAILSKAAQSNYEKLISSTNFIYLLNYFSILHRQLRVESE
jgi:hypothetical protein